MVTPRWRRCRSDGRRWRGESAAIAAALSAHVGLVLIDERRGRGVARRLGLDVIGKLGVLLRAKRAGLVDAIRPLLDDLVRHGFWIADAVRDRVLEAAGEVGEGDP